MMSRIRSILEICSVEINEQISNSTLFTLHWSLITVNENSFQIGSCFSFAKQTVTITFVGDEYFTLAAGQYFTSIEDRYFINQRS